MASEMLSKVLDAENSDREAQKAAHEQAQITVDAAVEAGEGAVARKKAEQARSACRGRNAQSRCNQSGHGDGYLMKRLINYRKVRRCQVGKA